MRLLILTGGLGRKLRPITDTRPKPMIEICGEPLLRRILKILASIGFNDAEIITGHMGHKIKNYLTQYPLPRVNVQFIDQKEPTGVGDALYHARHLFSRSDYFLLVYGDVLLSNNMINRLIGTFKTLKKPIASVCLTSNSVNYGNVYLDDSMRITKIIEKPNRNDLGNYILAGAFILPGTFFEYLESCELNMIDAIKLLSEREGFFASISEENWVDLGYPWDILLANQIIMNEWTQSRIAADLKQEGGSYIEGPVIIEEGVVIKSGATIIGPCFIGANSFIGHNALIRTYTSIGADSRVGFGVEMKNSVVMRGTEIGRLSFVGESIIGEEVNIGSGTVLVNINIDQTNVKLEINGEEFDSGLKKLGSIIGDKCWIGAGNTFLPGTKIPSGRVIPHHATCINASGDMNKCAE